MKTLSIIVPGYNEQDNIRTFYDAVLNAFETLNYKIETIFVDDGSTDNTLAEIKKLHQTDKFIIRYISFSRNFGKESAIYAGLNNASGDYLVLIDADMQQDPALIPDMLEILERDQNIDEVAYYQENRIESHFMKFMKKRFYKVLNSISEIELKADASDFRLFRRNVANAILELCETNRFSKGIFSWVGFHIEYLPYSPHERASGQSKWSLMKLIKYAACGITSFSVAPLKLAGIMGTFVSIGSFLFLLGIIIQKIFFGIDTPGFATIVTLIVFSTGIMTFFIGVLGEYLAKTFIESKHRPLYIVREQSEEKNRTQY